MTASTLVQTLALTFYANVQPSLRTGKTTRLRARTPDWGCVSGDGGLPIRCRSSSARDVHVANQISMVLADKLARLEVEALTNHVRKIISSDCCQYDASSPSQLDGCDDFGVEVARIVLVRRRELLGAGIYVKSR